MGCPILKIKFNLSSSSNIVIRIIIIYYNIKKKFREKIWDKININKI